MLKLKGEKNYKNMSITAKYTILFLVAAIVTFGYFIINKKSFVWQLDGLVQHNMALSYYGKWLRQIVKNIFVEHTFTIPMWSFGIGYGSDIITTLNYYVLGEPINLLSALVVPKYTEYLYAFLIVLRLYLSGLAFMQYCKIMNRKKNGIVVGAIAYVFTGYTMFAAIRHPFFVVPMIFFPLLLAGVEKILKDGKPFQFIFVIVLSAVSNFYFFYMMVFLTVIYTIVRCGFLYKSNILQSIKKMAFMLFYSVIAVMISAVLFLPVITFFLGDNRHDVGYSIPLLYNLKYYQQLFSGLITTQTNSTWTIMGYTPIVLLGVFYCFKKKNVQQIVFFFINIFILAIPFMGSFMNGLSYISNRWLWAFALFLSFLIVEYWEDILEVSIQNIKPLVAMITIYIAIICIMDNTRSLKVITELILLLLFIMTLMIMNQTSEKTQYKKELVVAMTVIIGVAVNSFFLYSFSGENYISEFIDRGQVYKTYQGFESNDVKKNIKDNEFFRFSSAGPEFNNSSESILTRTGIATDIEKNNLTLSYYDNATLLFGVNGIGFYWSLGNSNISDYLLKTEAREYPTYMYRGIDNRAGLLSLSSVKYYISEKENENMVPYGFKKSGSYKKNVPYHYKYKGNQTIKTTYNIYENQYALPLGYTYDSYISEKDAEKYTGNEKEEIMLQSAIVEKPDNSDSEKELNFSNRNLDYEIECYNGVTFKDNKFIVSNANAGAVIHFDSAEKTELYIRIKNLQAQFKNPLNQFEEQMENFSVAEQNLLKKEYKYWEEPNTLNLYFNDNYINTKLLQLSDNDGLYNGRSDYVVNLGYNRNKRNYVVIKFNKRGTYSFDELCVVENSYKKYKENILHLKEDVLSNVEISDNTIDGRIHLDKKKLLVLTVPYSNGWTLYVDGKKTKTEKVNYMYTGVYLEPGEHEIHLTYCTPGIKLGIFISLLGVFALLILFIINKVSRKNT